MSATSTSCWTTHFHLLNNAPYGSGLPIIPWYLLWSDAAKTYFWNLIWSQKTQKVGENVDFLKLEILVLATLMAYFGPKVVQSHGSWCIWVKNTLYGSNPYWIGYICSKLSKNDSLQDFCFWHHVSRNCPSTPFCVPLVTESELWQFSVTNNCHLAHPKGGFICKNVPDYPIYKDHSFSNL